MRIVKSSAILNVYLSVHGIFYFLGRLFDRVDLIKPVLNVCPYVRMYVCTCIHFVITSLFDYGTYGNHDTTTAILSARCPSQLRKHASSGGDLNLSVVSSIVCNVGTDKLVCNKRKSVLTESVYC